MTDKELDELFRNSFSGHQAPVPEEMWQRVNPQKEKKRRAIAWWSGLGVAALLLIGAFVWWNHTSSIPAQDSAIVSASPGSDKPQPSVAANDSTGQAIGHTEPLPQSIEAPATAADAKPFTEKRIGRNNRQVAIANRHNRYHPNELRNAGKPNEAGDEYSKEETTNAVGKTKVESADNGALQTNPSVLSPLASDSASTHQNNIAAKLDSAAATHAASAVQLHLPKRHKTSIELSVAGFAGDRNVYGVKKEVPAFSITMNEPHEKTTVQGYSLNVRIEKPISRHWSLKTGLQFLQARQSVTYNAESVSRYSVVNALGLGADTTQFTQISLHRPVTKSSYNSFHLPLLLSYHTDIKKLSIGATGGVLLNLYSWYKGEVPDGNYMRDLAAKDAFRPNYGSSLYLGLPVAKTFGKWQAFIEPQLQYSLSSITQNKASFKQKMTYYGVGIGIKRALKK